MTSKPTNRRQIQPSSLRRARLEHRLDAGLAHRLTAIVAGVGSGKTVMLRHWAQDRPVAWHTVSSADAELANLVRSILDALRLRLPKLSSELSLAVEGALGPDGGNDGGRAEGLAALVCEEMSTVMSNREVVLILDDIHRLSKAGARFVGALCMNAPQPLRIYAASREPMPFRVTRLALEGHLFEFPAEDLAFTVEETEQLLELIAGPGRSVPTADLVERTGGWAAGTRLAAEALRHEPDSELDDLMPTRGTGPLFDYLAEEVIGNEPKHVRELLATSALVPWITTDLADALGVGKGAASLDLARQRGIYFVGTDRWPAADRLAPVMRSYLLESPWMEKVDRAAALETAGQWFERVGALAEALASHQSAGRAEATASLIERGGSALLATGAGRVVEACESLPPALRADGVSEVEGEARLMIGDWDGALNCLRRVAPTDGAMTAGLAWRMGLLLHLRGELDDAIEAYRRGLIDGSDRTNESLLQAWTASALWLKGDHESCRILAASAMDLAHAAGDDRALAAAHTVAAMVAALDGDRNANDAHYLRGLEHAGRAQDLLQTIRIRANRGSRSLEEGEYSEALEELDVALRLADLAGFASFRALALSNRGQVHLHQGRLEEAVADLEEARRAFRSVGSSLESYALGHLGDVYRLRGDHALAKAAYEQAIALAERSGDLQGLVPAQAGLATLSVFDDLEQAAELADRAVANDSVLGHVQALIASGWVAHHAGDDERAIESAGKAADLASARRDRPGLAEALELQAAGEREPSKAVNLLHQARRIWEQVGDPLRAARVDVALAKAGIGPESVDLARSAARRLRRLGGLGLARDVDQLIDELQPSRPAVSIRTLGGFAVVRGGTAVASSEWQSKKARELLKLLVAARGRTQHREVLMDRLWPDDDPAKTSNRLSVALSTVRSVLDPDKAHPPDHYLTGDRDALGLALDLIDVDIEVFLSSAERGLELWNRGERETGISLLESAEALYVGDFLEEDLYAEWSIAVREGCRSVYMQLGGVLGGAYLSESDYDAAGRLFLRMLERDRFHEVAHLGLVRSMTKLGRHGAARRLYGQYVARMQELDVEAAPFPTDQGSPATR